ncbi:MAG: hypothetical protein DIAAKJNI_00530 [Candidatus Argoarchaeum ethanivorans]|uniref:Uncharacterized protein n=1 Tax=Candidatus Argoarchaeum ethanivorans TaxID=2608793 RepID=A0A811TFX0_9EURY|nr:MAG: hypothetical protein DIAAKJNI_00530 [Candidatus Argoarchaeum ethanivorans]
MSNYTLSHKSISYRDGNNQKKKDIVVCVERFLNWYHRSKE